MQILFIQYILKHWPCPTSTQRLVSFDIEDTETRQWAKNTCGWAVISERKRWICVFSRLSKSCRFHGWDGRKQPTSVALVLSSLAPLESSSKSSRFQMFQETFGFKGYCNPVATNARWHRKWSTDIAGIDRGNIFVGNTCGARLPNPNAGKSDTSEDIFNPSSKQLTIRIIMSFYLPRQKACARFKKSESFFERDLPIHTILRGAWI